VTHTTDSPAVSVIVPVYNEEQNVPILEAELRAALKGVDHEIIFVDDGSSDHTVERIEAAPNVRVIRFEKNAGQSAAIYAGLQAARGAILVLIDGDLQNDPADIPKLIAEIARGADLVCGYRAQRRDTVVKRLTSWIANAAQSNAARVRQRAGSVQGDASLHSCADQRRRVPAGGNSGEPSPPAVWANQIRSGQSCHARHHRHVRCAVAALAAFKLQDSGTQLGPALPENTLVKPCTAAKLGLPHGTSACPSLIYFLPSKSFPR